MKNIILSITIIFLLLSCSTHFSTIRPEGDTTLIYELSEQQAFKIAYNTMAAVLPDNKITEIAGPVRGYSAYFRFLFDTYSQQILIFPATGISLDNKQIEGYYFEVSGSGTSFIQGNSKNRSLYHTLENLLKNTNSAVKVKNLRQAPYRSIIQQPIGLLD